jgi:AcrR family transcriptional regulator
MSSANALPERAEQIFAAAYELFAAQGYHRTSMDAIAERAGVAKGTLYWYFKSKRELFIALFHHVTMGLINPWAPTEEGAYISPTERLKAGMAQFRNSTEQIWRIAHIMIQARAIDLDDDEMSRVIDSAVGAAAASLDEIIAAGVARGEFRPVSPQGMSLALISLVTGMALLVREDRLQEQWPSLLTAAETLVSSGLFNETRG